MLYHQEHFRCIFLENINSSKAFYNLKNNQCFFPKSFHMMMNKGRN